MSSWDTERALSSLSPRLGFLELQVHGGPKVGQKQTKKQLC